MGAPLAIVVPLAPGEQAWRGLLPSLLASTVSDVVVVHTHDARPDDLPGDERRVLRVASRQGRAVQLNAGAAATQASWLWFLHADSRLSTASFERLARFLATAPTGIGYFDLRFLDDGPGLVRINEWGARLRSRWLGLPFGDQGFVMRRETFHGLGGFDETLTGGEDHALVWRARRAGVPLEPIRADLWTSARKYHRSGWLRTTLWHLGATVAQARKFSGREAPR